MESEVSDAIFRRLEQVAWLRLSTVLVEKNHFFSSRATAKSCMSSINCFSCTMCYA